MNPRLPALVQLCKQAEKKKKPSFSLKENVSVRYLLPQEVETNGNTVPQVLNLPILLTLESHAIARLVSSEELLLTLELLGKLAEGNLLVLVQAQALLLQHLGNALLVLLAQGGQLPNALFLQGSDDSLLLFSRHGGQVLRLECLVLLCLDLAGLAELLADLDLLCLEPFGMLLCLKFKQISLINNLHIGEKQDSRTGEATKVSNQERKSTNNFCKS